jgi:hypothetical protein
MRTVVIYPGRFNTFNRGHKASYDYLVKKYGEQNVFVVSSNKQDPETSPFSFDDKMSMMTKLGISPGQIAHVANPYQAREITSEIDDKDNTVLIFAVSEKDMVGPDARFDFKPKKDGSASYIQPVPESGRLEPMTKHAYVAVTPTVNFRVRGADANSASQIRKKYIDGNDSDRDQIIADLYGDVDAGIRDIFDLKLGTGRPVEMVSESHARIAEKINQLRERIAQLKVKEESADYIEEKWSKKYKRSINCSNPKGFSQRAHCAGRKK